MRRSQSELSRLLATTALISAAWTSAAYAQAPEPVVQADEVVVTATRQATVISRVPMSISAVTGTEMEQRGIRTITDLVREVPGIRLSNYGSNDATQTISIRGIQSGGAPTTGVYLDDTPLAKRSDLVAGAGAPIPQLFDLERVEVLRGPQGTLYGAGSQGGAIRFITPSPSLTSYNAGFRVQLSDTYDGGLGYEFGGMFGAPLIQDKLGVRISAVTRRTAGYLDYVWRLTGEEVESDTNKAETSAIHASLLWEVTPNLRIQPAVYYSNQIAFDQDSFWQPVARFTAPARPAPHPAYTYGPYPFYGPYKSGDTCAIGDNFVNTIPVCVPHQPNKSQLLVPSLTVDYDFASVPLLGAVTAKNVLSYVRDRNKANTDFSYQVPQNFQAGSPFVFDVPFFQNLPQTDNKRYGITNEFRLASDNPDSRLTWVAGIYYANMRNTAYSWNIANLGDVTRVIFNQTVEQIYRAPLLPGGYSFQRVINLNDKEVAGYGEATFALTSQIKLIAGVRYSRTEFNYYQQAAGPIAGLAAPTVANGGIIRGTVVEKPVSPKAGVQWQWNDRNQVYFTASKGYRVGGINPTPPVTCATDLANLGISSTPTTFKSDTVWNYEGGAKGRVAGISYATSVFYMRWKDTQARFGLPTCGFGYNINAGEAVSKGVDFEASGRIIGGLSGRMTLGYNDAKYKEGVRGPAPSNTVFIQKGDPLPIPEWTYSIGLQYDFDLMSYPTFVRIDHQHTDKFERGVKFGSAGYSPDTRLAQATHFWSARAGTTFRQMNLSLFVDNLFNSTDILSTNGGRTGCNATSGAACTVFSQYNPVYRQTTFRPRTVGFSASVRY